MTTRSQSTILGLIIIGLFSLVVFVPLTLHEINNDGFFTGLWAAFTVLFRIVVRPFWHLTFWHDANAPYISGYAIGIFILIVVIIKSATINKKY